MRSRVRVLCGFALYGYEAIGNVRIQSESQGTVTVRVTVRQEEFGTPTPLWVCYPVHGCANFFA